MAFLVLEEESFSTAMLFNSAPAFFASSSVEENGTWTREWGGKGAACRGSSWNHLGSICSVHPPCPSISPLQQEQMRSPQPYRTLRHTQKEALKSQLSVHRKKPFLSFGAKVMCLWFRKTHGYSFPYWKWDHQTHSAKSPEIKIIFLEGLAGEFSHSVMSDSVTSWTAAHQASLLFTNSQSLLKLMSIVSVMPSNHLILCSPLLLLPSILPSIKVFFNVSVFRIKWPKYWSFSFSISPSSEYSGLISFRIDWLDLLAVQGTL